MKALGVIPARYGSTRFPGKPLSQIINKPMIQHVYERASLAEKLDKILVATDDERIYKAVKSFNGEAVMTASDIQTGTDRVYEASRSLDFDIILNIQGDEPLIDPELLNSIVSEFGKDDNVYVVTPVKKIESTDELLNPNLARVTIDKKGFALYFSRAAIPYNRDKEIENWLEGSGYYRHIGVYGFSKLFLQRFVEMGSSNLENIEKLEQLRILENGYRIKTVLTEYNPVCVDVPQDLEKVEEILKKET